MKDPRLRLLSVVVLSAAAFASVHGALLAFLWWACTVSGPLRLWRSRWPLLVFSPLPVVALVLLATGGEWVSYSLRLAAVLLVAVFAFQHHEPGEFLGVATWLLGRGIGFDCGLAGEIALSGLAHLRDEVTRYRWALSQKGIPWGIRAVGPVATGLLWETIARASDQADILVARGYTRGGSACARFEMARRDVILSAAAVAAGIAAFLPIGEFFILSQ